MPIIVVNLAIYRKNAGLESYDEKAKTYFSKYIDRFIENYSNFKISYKNLKELLDRFYKDVVVQGQYDEEIKKIIEQAFLKILQEQRKKAFLKSRKIDSKMDLEAQEDIKNMQQEKDGQQTDIFKN